MRVLRVVGTFLLTFTVNAQEVPVKVRTNMSNAGTVHVNAMLNEQVSAKFMIDTGSSIVVLNQHTFDRLLKYDAAIVETTPMGARLANGQIKLVKRFRVPTLSLSDQCHFDNVEIAVMADSKNILGMNVLGIASPFTLDITAGEMRLSRCDRYDEVIMLTQF